MCVIAMFIVYSYQTALAQRSASMFKNQRAERKYHHAAKAAQRQCCQTCYEAKPNAASIQICNGQTKMVCRKTGIIIRMIIIFQIQGVQWQFGG